MDLRVASYWIDTLVRKNRRKYLRYFAASSSPLRGNPTQCSRGSKKNFWCRCRGGLRKSSQYLCQGKSASLKIYGDRAPSWFGGGRRPREERIKAMHTRGLPSFGPH